MRISRLSRKRLRLRTLLSHWFSRCSSVALDWVRLSLQRRITMRNLWNPNSLFSRSLRSASTTPSMGDEIFVFSDSPSVQALDGVTVVNPSAEYSTLALWAACGVRDKSTKMVRDFSRSMISGVRGKSAHLKCGTVQNWGYRHIKAEHLSDWQAKTAYLGGSWQPFADWAMRNTLATPCAKYRRVSNDTLQYVAPIQIRNSRGQVVHTFGTRVSVARVTQNIITSYPQSATCR